MKFDGLVKDFLGDLEKEVQKKLIAELENIGKEFAIEHVTKTLSRTILKGIDGIVAVTVKLSDRAHAGELAHGYLDVVDEQFLQLQEALKTYVPLQIAVEVAKKEFGKNSAEANAARKEREQGIEEVREEVSDIIAALLGEHVTD